jgi:hypothetical protein
VNLIETDDASVNYRGFDGNDLIDSSAAGTTLYAETVSEVAGLYGMDSDGLLKSITLADLRTLLLSA